MPLPRKLHTNTRTGVALQQCPCHGVRDLQRCPCTSVLGQLARSNRTNVILSIYFSAVIPQQLQITTQQCCTLPDWARLPQHTAQYPILPPKSTQTTRMISLSTLDCHNTNLYERYYRGDGLVCILHSLAPHTSYSPSSSVPYSSCGK